MVSNFVKNEIKDNLNGDPKKLWIGGFSQGCAMSLQIAFNFEQDLGGVIGCSGHLLPTISLLDLDESKKSIPIFLYHGEKDAVIPCSVAEK